MSEPQYEITRTIHGGEVEHLSQPHVRCFPNPLRKRPVKVTVMTWKGIAPGAHHFHVRIDGDPNPIWDGREGCWRLAFGDRGARDCSYYLACETELSAWEFVKCVWDEHLDHEHCELLDALGEPLNIEQKLCKLRARFS